MLAAVDTRHEFGSLASLYLWVISIAVAVVVVVVVFTLVRYRKRGAEGPVRGRSDANVVESLYALGLAAIAVVLIGATFHVENKVDRRQQAKIHVDVTAFQWGWRFSLDGRVVIGDAARPPVLRLPANQPIEFVLTSRDVIHSFWVPGERFKRDAFPGRTTRFTLTFAKPGVYRGHCAEFCGLLHADMDFTLVIR